MQQESHRIYGDVASGNCYKVKLLCEQLRLRYEWIAVDILNRETRADSFLARNPNGKIPLLELPSGVFLAESNAILHYLADGSALLPEDRLERAQTLQWMFFEQYSHEPYIATARYIVRYLGRPAQMEQVLQSKMEPGYRALQVMETHLRTRTFFVGERYGIADIALFAYTHVAHEGGFSLAEFPAIARWIGQVRAQPGFVTIG